MEFTKDLIECVNNDTKELMYDSTGSSGRRISSYQPQIYKEGTERIGTCTNFEDFSKQTNFHNQLFLTLSLETKLNIKKLFCTTTS